jgi:hypothetical protein
MLHLEFVAIPAGISTKVLLFILLIVQENIRHTSSIAPAPAAWPGIVG